MDQPEFLNIQDAAERFGISRFTIWRLIRDGRLDAYQSEIDRRERLVRVSDVQELLRPRRVDEGKVAA